ncbi:MAG TPA: S9 family peptidase [Acidobacteriaceae bacterium]|nr:S9 family peptidase [Acidobacteriaceae bacterium]
MKTSCLLLASACASLLVAPIFGQSPANLATSPVNSNPKIPAIIHSLEQVKYIAETRLSPDGKHIAWTVDREGILVAPLRDPARTEHITACGSGMTGNEGGIAWSPDSKTLAFFSNCTTNHKTGIFTDDVSAEASPVLLTELDGYAKSLTYSPNGKYLTFLYVKGATRPSGALAAMKPPAGVIGVEGIEVQRVATVDAKSGALWQATPANLHVYEFDWSPDAKKLAFIAGVPPGEDNWWTAKLYTLQASCIPPAVCRVYPQPKVLLDPNTTTGPLHGLQIAVPRWSPDGKEIALIGGLMSDQGVTGGDIYVMPSTGEAAKDLTPDLTTTPTWIHWKSNKEIQFTEIASGATRLNHLKLPDGTSNDEGTIDFTLPESVGAGGLMMNLSFANNGTAAMIRSSFNLPPEVWTWSPKPYAGSDNFTQITRLNRELKPAWGEAQSLGWTNQGYRIDGWLLYPANYDPHKKYPLIVYVHGGPAYANLPRWPYPGYGPAPFSALGYFVLMPNPRGSYGEGERFTQANRKDFGYGDLRDILAGVDTVIKMAPVDPNRVGITGWSYGGFMTMFSITQTHRFKAAVAGAGISDWKSYYGENSIDKWMIPYFGASVYNDPAAYAKSSAINYIKNVKTPTLIVVGARDGECPAPQSFEFWHALQYEHVPSELVVYPDEGHGFSKPADRINVLERALGWFEEYMP